LDPGAAFGVNRRPIYPVLRGIAGDFRFGTNFASYGAPARTVKVWRKDSGFNTPFSLDVQLQWFHRYAIRVWFYEKYPSTSKISLTPTQFFMLLTTPTRAS
jgi:hypothetical protein